jgi:hypothetical protein
MNQDYAHVTVLVDRTGSMHPLAEEASVAVNKFISEQAQLDGKTASLRLVDFDSMEPQRIVFDGDISHAPKYRIEPRGMTPLYDAMGKEIRATGAKLAAMNEEDRPAQVFFVVVTDGEENASVEWRLEPLRKLISEHEETYSWQFVFLAQGLDAINQADAFTGTQMVTNSTVRSRSNTAHTYSAAIQSVSASMLVARAGGQSVNFGADIDDQDEDS